MPPADPQLSPRDAAWLAGLRAGDAAIFEAIFSAYFDTLYRLAYHDVRSQPVAEEILQDVFCALWEARATLAIHTSFEGYLVRAVRHRTLSYLRHDRVVARHAEHARMCAPDLTPRPTTADIETERRELNTAIARAVERLPPRARQAYVLYHRDGLSYAQIASVMGISPRGVETNLAVALRRLRAELARFLPQY